MRWPRCSYIIKSDGWSFRQLNGPRLTFQSRCWSLTLLLMSLVPSECMLYGGKSLKTSAMHTRFKLTLHCLQFLQNLISSDILLQLNSTRGHREKSRYQTKAEFLSKRDRGLRGLI